MTEHTISVRHVQRTVEKPYAAFQAALQRQLGRFDAQAHEKLLAGGDSQQARALLEQATGTSGFMLFDTIDHGQTLALAGKTGKAVQYVLGNPLLAVEMTRYAIGAALYAPLRMLIYEAPGGGTCIEYDLPTSLFGQFGDENVDRVAESLDLKLEVLIATAAE
jgi:uncharacterized protein (DUF302 family)